MTKNRDLKQRIRDRMAKTGETYSTARMHVLAEGRRTTPTPPSAEAGTPNVAEHTPAPGGPDNRPPGAIPSDGWDQHADKVVHEMWRRCLVAVVWQPTPNVFDHGCGILIVGADGQVGVLTAGHVADHVISGELCEMAWEENGLTVGEPFVGARRMEKWDVGFIFLQPRLQPVFREFAISMVAIGDPRIVNKPGDGVVIAGFPKQLDRLDDQQIVRLYGVHYSTRLREQGNELAAHWATGVPRESLPSHGFEAGKQRAMGSAEGTSGGAVWYCPPVPQETLWTPERQAKIVGIPTHWDYGAALIKFVPVAIWRSWLGQCLNDAQVKADAGQSDMAAGDKLQTYLAAKKAFQDRLQEFLAGGIALHYSQRPDPMLSDAVVRKHDQLVDAERRAVDLHRKAFGGPQREYVLAKACDGAGIEQPGAGDDVRIEFWLDRLLGEVPADRRDEAHSMLNDAVRFARDERMFSAEHVLTVFRERREFWLRWRAEVASSDSLGAGTGANRPVGLRAAEAAWRVLESAGFEKLSAEAWRELEAAGVGRQTGAYGGVFFLAPAYTVRFYTRLPVSNPITGATQDKTVAFGLVVGPDRARAQITTEPEGGIVWGVAEGPSDEEGAVALANRIVTFVRQARRTADGAAVVSEPMRKDVLERRFGGGPPDAHIVHLRFDPKKGQTFEDAVRALRQEASTRRDLLEAGIRRMDRAGHPWVCTWRRASVDDAWRFAWDRGADDPAAEPLTL